MRCRQTAEIVCEALGGTPVEDPRLRPGCASATSRTRSLEHSRCGRLLVCGHEPDLSEIVAELTGGGMVDFKKGSLAMLDVESLRPGRGRLRALYPPATLRLLAG